MMAAFYDNATTDKSEFTKLSDEQSQARLSYAMTMSKSRKSKFMCKPNAEPSLLELC